MTAGALAILGVLSIIFNGIGMALTSPFKSKILIGTAVALIVPDLYYSGGIHGSLQSVFIAILFFIGAFGLKQWEKGLKFFLPLFTLYLLYDIQDPMGIFLVVAGITTPLATITKKNKNVKRLLLISAFCWGIYAFYHGAWFAFAFDIAGVIGITISLFKEFKLAKIN